METIAVTRDLHSLLVIELLEIPDFRVVAIKPHPFGYSEEVEEACPGILDIYLYDATMLYHICSMQPCIELYYLYSTCEWSIDEETSERQYELLRESNVETDIVYYDVKLCDRPFSATHKQCQPIDPEDLDAGITYGDALIESIDYAQANHYI
jgi:hypothetical protein